jgi:hypothetical protein
LEQIFKPSRQVDVGVQDEKVCTKAQGGSALVVNELLKENLHPLSHSDHSIAVFRLRHKLKVLLVALIVYLLLSGSLGF